MIRLLLITLLMAGCSNPEDVSQLFDDAYAAGRVAGRIEAMSYQMECAKDLQMLTEAIAKCEGVEDVK